MFRAKKAKMTASSSTEDFTIYLRDPSLLENFHKFYVLNIAPGRFVKFSDLADYNLARIFSDTGLLDLYDCDNLTYYYPNLIYLFFTNLICDTSMAKKPVLVSLVTGIEIKLTPQIIGKILNVPYKGEFLDEIDMIDEDVLYNKILLPGKTLPMFSNKLRLVPRLVSRILSYNLLPKTGSFDHMSHELQVATYAIMTNI